MKLEIHAERARQIEEKDNQLFVCVSSFRTRNSDVIMKTKCSQFKLDYHNFKRYDGLVYTLIISVALFLALFALQLFGVSVRVCASRFLFNFVNLSLLSMPYDLHYFAHQDVLGNRRESRRESEEREWREKEWRESDEDT